MSDTVQTNRANFYTLAITIRQREGGGMTQTDSDRIMELCRLICEEHNPSKFQKLVTELNQLLLRKERNLANPPDSTSATLRLP